MKTNRCRPSLLLQAVLQSLDDAKAEDIVTIDLNQKSTMADYMVIASGRSSRHVQSMAENIARELKHQHGLAAAIEGKGTGDWALLDAGDVVVHMFRPEVRDHYRLEKLWSPPNELEKSALLNGQST
ncbi:MAG: ribosome silencing factor [Alphaproteobacteria bacterium]|nr:ribosome silencing factor [Alphaproteobacteria bacterium]